MTYKCHKQWSHLLSGPGAYNILDSKNRSCVRVGASPVKSFGYTLLTSTWRTFCLPVTLTLSSTIPDCRMKRKLYPLTFVMSIVWISVVTYVLSWMLTICGRYVLAYETTTSVIYSHGRPEGGGGTFAPWLLKCQTVAMSH